MSRLNMLLLPLVSLLVPCACTSGGSDSEKALPAPSELRTEQVSENAFTLTWKDNCTEESGYYVFRKEDNDAFYGKPFDTLPANASSYTFENLKQGVSYQFGVQAFSSDGRFSTLVYAPECLLPVIEPAHVHITALKVTSAFITVEYAADNTVKDITGRGVRLVPRTSSGELDFPAQDEAGLQVITASALQEGMTYDLRVYVRSGETRLESDPEEVTLAATPEPITFSWTDVTPSSFPKAIHVYETRDNLEGRPFHGWYAIADCTGNDVEFRVLNPDGKYTIDQQAEAAGGCYVLINGGIYGTKHIGPVIADGVLSAWRDEADAQYWGADGKLHYITRSMFGVDAAGHPLTCYSFHASQGQIRYYDRPIPSVSGTPLYGPGTETFPCTPLSWSPRQAITTGPLVLHHGMIPVDLSKTADGAWVTNFELWADDIFADHPDRTAVGYTEDGKIVLFICDGRITESQGAYLSEVGRIMKGLGCVGALNLDGGGSTGMWAAGEHLNSLVTGTDGSTANRPVMTTLGFFKKR